MFYNAKNAQLKIGSATMDYVSFGVGSKNLIMIPGLGDGLRNSSGMALPFAIMYRDIAKEYRVYVFSRKNELEPGCTTRDMARDVREAMDLLGIKEAAIVGVSQGGMIAQHLAVDYPEVVSKLVLVVTVPRASECLTEVISGWMEMARKGQFRELMVDNILKMYTEGYINKNKWMLKVAGKFGEPDSYERFLVMAEACITHDCYDSLGQIKAPTLVIGGEMDITVGAQGSKDIAEKIENCRLVMYPDYGHALYEEAKDFTELVLGFLRE